MTRSTLAKLLVCTVGSIATGAIFASNAAEDHPPLSIYTSPVTHYVPQAGCHPGCHPDQGDQYTVVEPIPYKLDPAGAHLLCDGNGCPFDNKTVSIDNNSHMATIRVKSRSLAVVVRLQAGILP